MRKFLVVLLAASTVGVTAAEVVSAEEVNEPGTTQAQGPKQSLVALGDSITAGHGIGHGNAWANRPKNSASLVSKDAYPQLLGDAANYKVNNLAVSGWTSGDLLDAVTNQNRYRNAIKKADVITLNIGSNDLLSYFNQNLEAVVSSILYGTPMPAFPNLSGNIIGILTQIKGLNPDATIVVYGLYNPFYVGHPSIAAYDQAAQAAIVAELDNVIAGANAQLSGIGYPYVDVQAALNSYTGSKSDLFIDSVHPSELGQQLISGAPIQY